MDLGHTDLVHRGGFAVDRGLKDLGHRADPQRGLTMDQGLEDLKEYLNQK